MATVIKPFLSVIMIAYKMPRQALNTLYTLSCRYQENITENDYEILLIENLSDNMLDEGEIKKTGHNIRYLINDEKTTSPAGAINLGLSLAKGHNICLMIDGARMLTPRTLEYGMSALKASPDALAAVPGYSLGWQDQRFHKDAGYSEAEEIALLEKIQWKNNGYRLFDIATLSNANNNGYINPIMECNCVFSSRKNFQDIGGANMDFQLPGGGSINLHMFRQLGVLPQVQHFFVIPGEGSFHQFHGGITTAQWDDLDDVLETHRKQLHSYWDNDFHSLRREPIFLGSITSHAQRFLHHSTQKAKKRLKRLKSAERKPWPDDPHMTLNALYD